MTTAPLSPIDQAIGGNLRALRMLRNLSEEALATALDMPLEMFRDIETGRRRLDARDLYQVSKVLKTTSSAFFAATRNCSITAGISARVNACGIA